MGGIVPQAPVSSQGKNIVGGSPVTLGNGHAGDR